MLESSDSQGTRGSRIVNASKHPLLVLLVGTLLGSVALPYVNERAARARQLSDLRAARALAAVQASDDTERRLNILLTTFEAFWKDTGEATLESRRPELRTKVYALYEEFDRTAWWWFDEAWQQAYILGLLDTAELEDVKEAADEYRRALLEGTNALDPIWHISLRQSPPPGANHAFDMLQGARTALRKSRDRRLASVALLVHTLMRRPLEEAPNTGVAPGGVRRR